MWEYVGLKILHINTSLGRGGTAVAVVNISKSITRLGHDSLVLNSETKPNAESKHLWIWGNKIRHWLNVLSYRCFGQEGFFNHGLWLHWLESIKDYDVIHLHKIHDELIKILNRENRTELYKECLKFLKTRIDLDLALFRDDIWAH